MIASVQANEGKITRKTRMRGSDEWKGEEAVRFVLTRYWVTRRGWSKRGIYSICRAV
jgi:hypothetical protein